MKKAVMQGLLLLMITVLVGTLVGIHQEDHVRVRKEKANLINLSVAAQVEEKINREIYLTNLIELLLRVNEEEPFPAFQQAVSEIVRFSPARSAVQLSVDGLREEQSLISGAPFGGRRFRAVTAPSEDGDAGHGRDLRGFANSAELTQGGDALVAYHPVYDGAGDFWGFFIVPVDVEALLKGTRSFQELTRDNYCAIAVLAGADSKMIYSNLGGVVDFEPVRTEIRLADGTVWAMTLAPKEGWLSTSQRWINGGVAALVVLVLYQLLSNLGKFKRQLVFQARLATLDALTNTFNKRAFEQKLEELDQGIEPYGLIFLDLDYFKEINDHYGHDAGDQVLREMAQRMKQAVRDVDKVYRVGGDEFVIFIGGGLSPEAYDEVRKRLKADVEGKPIVLALSPLYIHISMGYAGRPADGEVACEVLKVADQRMYEDKQRNHSCFAATEAFVQPSHG